MIGFGNLENSFSWGPLSIGMALVAAGRVASCPSMKEYSLKSLFKKLPIINFHGDWKVSAHTLISDSRRVMRGSIFFAVRGLHDDGNTYLEEAIDKGAVAIVSSEPMPSLCPVAYIQVEDVRATLAAVAKRFYDQPDAKMPVVGITGTNGKTTVSQLLQYLLQEEQHPVGLIGTVRYDLGGRSVPSYRTTPESLDIYAMLSQMYLCGCQGAVMEVSSHGLDQKRVEGMQFQVAAFLNLTQDHLDYHQSMEAYLEAKKRLFDGSIGTSPKITVLNADDSHFENIKQSISKKTTIKTFGLKQHADFFAKDIIFAPKSTQFTLVYDRSEFPVSVPLPGLYNVSNALAALCIATSLGRNIQSMIQKMASFAGVPGRMESVEKGQSFSVFVDYAHTEDALVNALDMLKAVTPGNIYTVVGCGGNRDQAKRPKMMAAAADNSHHVFVTSDNPRKESVQSIFSDMRKGLTSEAKATFIDDRKEAILAALKAAKPGDCVLIAGKGHEVYQEFADTAVPFNDKLIAEALLEELQRVI